MIIEKCPLVREQITLTDYSYVDGKCRLCQKSHDEHKWETDFKMTFLIEHIKIIHDIKMNGEYKPFKLCSGEIKETKDKEFPLYDSGNSFSIITKINENQKIAYNCYCKILDEYENLRCNSLLTKEECDEKMKNAYADYINFCKELHSICDQLCG